VAIGLLRVRGACKRERGDGGWKKASCGHLTFSLPSARSSVGARRHVRGLSRWPALSCS
jgi:hypothetical protein